MVIDERAGRAPLRAFWEPYRRTWGGLSPSTKVSYDTAWRLRIEPRFGDVKVRRIKPSDIDAWIGDMIDAGRSQPVIVETVGVLRRVLNRAVSDKVIPSNPCAERGIQLPRKQQVERPVLSPSEVEKVAQACKNERDAVLLRFLAYSGCRIGEALALRWVNVDLESRTVRICESISSNTGKPLLRPTKTYASRTIDIPRKVAEQLLTLQKSQSVTALVFANGSGGVLYYRNWRSRCFDPAAKRAGVKVLPHDLRSTCASLLIDAGASPKDVQVHLGHSSIAITMNVYARVRKGRSADLAGKLDALIAEA
jgi:integrase